MQKFSTYFILLLAILTTVSCKKDNKGVYDAEINNITDNIIIATYSDLDAQAAVLLDAVNALKNGGATSVELATARTAWQATRAPWEASEGFLFGPVSDNEIDPNIDTWPLDSIGVDNILAGTDIINKTYIDNLTGDAGTGLKGFHAIEYFLWGTDGNKVVADFTARELDYLIAAVESLKGKTAELKNAWISSGGNFAKQLKDKSSRYPSEVDVLIELAEGIRGIAGEVFDTKIQNTLDGLDADGVAGGIREEESRFSNNTKSDFTNNIQSIANVYLGLYATTGNGKGLSDVVASKNTTLDAKIKLQISEAIAGIKSIGGSTSATYSAALEHDRLSIEAAQTKVATLEETIRTELIPLISGL
ncbi:MAG TPA: imelysin family protein [Chitinophagales bacterium]|nr:imelysin family protein [Chitinophagales bacterium]HMW12137.1 imelysin family protein [Chitinophagales bacterium]HMX59925.1 imelysin family protein [Chitinophagales bacterium]HMY23952.1 imelysin family protein [Chitinophagales bacterium]HMZ33549.1 imelysin family protein [Chitinophagales bacterium]